MKQNKGFTLLELMIVIAIIAIVASIAIPTYTGYVTTARMVEAKNNIAALTLAEEEYFLEKNMYFYDTSNDNTNLSNASDTLWTASKGDDGNENFIYTVTSTLSGGYTINATGVGTHVAGKTESYTR